MGGGVAEAAAAGREAVTRERFDAVLFDLDGVLTDTARIHAACWKRVFDDLLERRARARGEPFRPFEIATDYRLHVDGRARLEGVRTFLASRDIELPEGAADGPPGEDSVRGIARHKDALVDRAIAAGEVAFFEGSLRWLRHLRAAGLRIAVVSASHHCAEILEAADLGGLFEARIDGQVADARRLAGKPAPDTYLAAAAALDVEPARAVVVEDALAGVRAGRAGGFGLVVGVARHGDRDALARAGADLVVADLGELLP
jgi:beta-phosphoglucomutase family hydrolase